MAHFLCFHNMFPQAQSLLHFLVSRKGKDSACSVFASLVETKGTQYSDSVFDALMIAYTDNGFVSDAIQCFRLVRKHNFRVPFRGCGSLLDKMMKSKTASSACAFYMKVLDCGYPPNGKIREAQLVFEEIPSGVCVPREGRVVDAERTMKEMLSAGMKPDDATYTMVMDGFCKKGDVKMGFKLLKEIQSDGYVPGVVTYNVLMNGLCKLGQMKNANMLLDAMLNLGVVPDDITYNILLEGHCRNGNPEHFDRLRSEKGLISDYASYTSIGVVDGFEWVCSGVYGPSDDSARNDMWVELDSMRLQWGSAWRLIGDFNIIRYSFWMLEG
ncbi:putative pentatricopeptide repeat-containing protein [Quercus suber]|uniref:Pentatricopeptide repeat-containing protein n=1 Tax=Quercus suber TaxID=58331 RepID=A0AAW0JVH4_QUESU